MSYLIRPIEQDDVPFLWEMLFYAAHMSEDGLTTSEPAKRDPHLNIYVDGWGRDGDYGFIAYTPQTRQNIGAAWLRLIISDKTNYGYYDDATPELAIAVIPEMMGRGIGSLLLSALIDSAKTQYPAIILTVRSENPAKNLYERNGFIVIDEVINRVGTKSSKMLLKF